MFSEVSVQSRGSGTSTPCPCPAQGVLPVLEILSAEGGTLTRRSKGEGTGLP